MRPKVAWTPRDVDHALLVGEVAGTLCQRFDATLETDEDGYTGRILVERPSGTWVLTIALEGA